MSYVALGAPLLTSIDPEEINPVDRLQSPSLEHWFGTDHLGRDIFARTLYGGRISLIVGLCVSTMSTFVGLVIGLLSGYTRRLERGRHARHGWPDGHSRHLTRHCPDGIDPRPQTPLIL